MMNQQFGTPTGYGPMYNFPNVSSGGMQYSDAQFSGHSGYGMQFMYPFQDQRGQLLAEHNAANDGKTESKPRLSKEEVDKLEKIFQENPKPSSSVKAQLADELNLERPRINVSNEDKHGSYYLQVQPADNHAQNWFQNRRAKAKQEKRQEEYEASRMAERDFKSLSAPVSPEENAAAVRPENFAEPVPKRMNHSTALFPAYEPLEEDVTEDKVVLEDMSSCFASHTALLQKQTRDTFQTLPALNMGFTHSHASAFSPESFGSPNTAADPLLSYNAFVSHDNKMNSKNDNIDPSHGLPSPEEDNAIVETAIYSQQNMLRSESNSTTPTAPTHGQTGLPQSSSSSSLNSLAPGFRSPPPPADLASRRKIPRPAALQALSLKSRAPGSGHSPKTALDGSRQYDPRVPANSMRRIASATGPLSGRIQKATAGSRSPMFFGRGSEALLQYHALSPASSVGPLTSPFSVAPTTPMTPALLGMQSLLEPVVTSSADDEAFLLGANAPLGFMNEYRSEKTVKTPPGTPGMLINTAAQFPLQNYASTAEQADQPLMTPYFQTDFSGFHRQHEVPSYVDVHDNSSLPSTPLYPNMSTMDQHHIMSTNTNNSTQFDWDANESVTSSKSSPGVSRSNVLFAQPVTQHDYSLPADQQ